MPDIQIEAALFGQQIQDTGQRLHLLHLGEGMGLLPVDGQQLPTAKEVFFCQIRRLATSGAAHLVVWQRTPSGRLQQLCEARQALSDGETQARIYGEVRLLPERGISQIYIDLNCLRCLTIPYPVEIGPVDRTGAHA